MIGIQNPDVLLSPLTTQEAVLSSKIEGTQTTMSEVFEYEAGIASVSEKKSNDIQEVLNYRTAMKVAVASMEKYSLSLRVVKEAHFELMQGVRGKSMDPGEFRKVPAWIGPEGEPIEKARYVAINAGDLPSAIGDWESYVHQDELSNLVRLAVAHAEFEAVHPFLDGNGRVGRLLIPLFLVHKGILHHPSFYLSEYLEQNRDEYYERLLAVSRDGDWTGWCHFFLYALAMQGVENQIRVLKILKLHADKKAWADKVFRSRHGVTAIDWFFRSPIFSSSNFVKMSGIPKPTAHRILQVARDSGLLKYLRPPSGRRSGVLIFPELLTVAEGTDSD